MARKKDTLELLVEKGLITKEQIDKANSEARRTGLSVEEALARLGFISEVDIANVCASTLGVPFMSLSGYLIDPEMVKLVPESLARKHKAVPLFKIGNTLTLAMVDPRNLFALDEIRMKTDLIIEPAVSTESDIKKALDECYSADKSIEEVVKSIDDAKLGLKKIGEEDLKKLEGIAEEPAIIRLVNMIIMRAIREKASDIHIEPEEEALKARFRVDGILREVFVLSKHIQSAAISRIKIMANLDIAERRIPQDGRFNIKMEGREIDVRVSCMPMLYGENVVMRLLDVSNALLKLEDMGFSMKMLEKHQKLIFRPHGIVLVTGPTGSGKTTTLYASLNKINTVEKNIVTIEDPIEYRLSGIRQIQVNPKVKLTFASGLRSILRQDPDIIMVGEMRDIETAEIAIQAALTGHLVFSTLHTNDAPGAITRIIDMGLEPFLIASSVIGILAQRLLRVICPACKEKYTPTGEALQNIGFKEDEKIEFYRGKGCSKCTKTGYKGRIGIFELMLVDEKIRNLIIAKVPLEEIRKQAIASGMVTLKENGIDKIREGLTTIEEVLRATEED